MLYGKVMAAYYKDHVQEVTTRYAQNVEYFNVNHGCTYSKH